MIRQSAEDRFRRFIRSGQSEDRYFDRSMIGNIFDIDTNGNHTPRTFGLAHELTAIATDPQSFDAKGNVTQIPGSLRGMTSDILLSWDFDNRLKSSTVDSTTTDYGYDALGRRVSKESVVFVYGGAGQQNCIAEYASAAAPTSPDREFVYGDSIDSLVLISDTNDTRRLLANRNQQWSVVALVDLSDGAVVERYTYDHFGARRVLDASGAEISGSGQYGMSASQYGNPYGYTSRRHDTESGLMYFRARFYDPTTGEFVGLDPRGQIDGASLYRGYMVPKTVDPLGLQTTKPTQQAVNPHGPPPEPLRDPTPPQAPNSCGSCDKYYDSDIRNSKRFRGCWRAFVEQAKRRNLTDKQEEVCLGLKFKCETCPGNGGIARYSVRSHVIIMCANNPNFQPPKSPLAPRRGPEYLCHELIHVLQSRHCNAKPWPQNNCFDILTKEMQAYYCQGVCRNGRGCLPHAVRSARLADPNCQLTQQELDMVKDWLDKAIKNGNACPPGWPRR